MGIWTIWKENGYITLIGDVEVDMEGEVDIRTKWRILGTGELFGEVEVEVGGWAFISSIKISTYVVRN